MSKKRRDPRTVERVLTAAHEVETESAREAAVLGGLVRSLLDTGHLKINYVRKYVPECVAYFGRDIRKVGDRIDVSAPSDAEIRKVASKFLEKYDPGSAERVAA